MPFGAVTLVPGVNQERTPTLLRASIAESQYIRFKDSLVQKYGGWTKLYPFSVGGVPRDLHAWQDLNETDRLAVGTTTELDIITEGALATITPQTLTSDTPPDFTTSAGSPVVTITDPNVTNITTYDAVYFNTPISVDGIILSGLYAIEQITGVSSYQIRAASNALAGVSSGGAVPIFTTTSGASLVSVGFPNHGLSLPAVVVFPIATTDNGVTILGAYAVNTITDDDNFVITADAQADASGAFSMNGGDAEFVYYIALGPPAVGAGYGLGGYGEGGYGTGTTSDAQTGTPITATDWTTDNWGEIMLACPEGGGVYQYNPTAGFQNAQLVSSAPVFNGGLFVSMAQQILVCWGSTAVNDIGVQRDPMLVRWSSVGDYSDFVARATNQAGSYRIPIGSMIRTGGAVSNQNLLWTDLDLWAMNYQGPPFVFGFNKIGAGAGSISSHAAQQLRGNVYWMGLRNFYSYTPAGVAVLPCPIWDVVFQNLNASFLQNVRAMPNTPFNEVGWLYPSTASVSGENDSYVKFNITEPGAPWDYGSIARSSWIDQSVLGTPVAATPGGIIYQHENTSDADGSPIAASFTTGYFYLAEGEDFCSVDQIYPDFKYGMFDGAQTAQIQLTFNLINYPGDTPTTYGPYTVTQDTDYLSVRFRGRQMSITVASADIGSFWRLGHVRYRWRPAGRRG